MWSISQQRIPKGRRMSISTNSRWVSISSVEYYAIQHIQITVNFCCATRWTNSKVSCNVLFFFFKLNHLTTCWIEVFRLELQGLLSLFLWLWCSLLWTDLPWGGNPWDQGSNRMRCRQFAELSSAELGLAEGLKFSEMRDSYVELYLLHDRWILFHSFISPFPASYWRNCVESVINWLGTWLCSWGFCWCLFWRLFFFPPPLHNAFSVWFDPSESQFPG